LCIPKSQLSVLLIDLVTDLLSLFLQFLDVGGSARFIEITDGFVGYILCFLENGSCLLISIAENFVFSLVDFFVFLL
jgi:hypothetical protein